MFHSTELSVSLKFSPESLAFIDEYQSNRGSQFKEAYLPADVTIALGEDVYEFPLSGVRMKGNTSRRHFLSGDDIYQPVHFKVNLKSTFDGEEYDTYPELAPFKKTWEDEAERKAQKKRNLFGIEKFDLKYVPRNRDTGSSCIAREIYAYDKFREADIPAPYANLCKTTISNGISQQTYDYEIIECIDKQFLKRRFEGDDVKGDLYKCVYNGMGKADLTRDGAVTKTYDNGLSVGAAIRNGKIGVEDNYSYYEPVYQLKTNDDAGQDSDFSKMATYINGIWNVLYGGQGNDLLESILDVDEFTRFSAVSYLLGNFDDQRYDANNYYLYFVPSTGKAIYIPYDWDWCLGLGDGFGLDTSRLKPNDEAKFNEGDVPNVYPATYFTSPRQGLTVDRSSYQQSYRTYVEQYRSSVLDYDGFLSCLTSYNAPYDELDQVKSYMETKLQYAIFD